MNGPSTYPTPDSSPIIATPIVRKPQVGMPPEAPPVVPPPIVRPPHCSAPVPPQVVPAPVVQPKSDTLSFLKRGMRDVMIGGICVVVGMVAAQSNSLLREPARSFALADPSRLVEIETSENLPLASNVDVPPARVAVHRGLPPMISSVSARVDGPAIEAFPSLPPLQKAIEDTDDALSDIAETGIAELDIDLAEPASASTAEPSVSDATLSRNSTSQQQPVLQKVNPAVALEKIVAAQASLKSLPKMGLSSAIMPVPQSEDGTCQVSTRSLGTALNWADTPADAYRQAGEAEKLVFLIHVSGNFEIPGFT